LRIVAISTEVHSIMEASGLLRIFSVDDGPVEIATGVGLDGEPDDAAWIRSGAFQNQEVVGQ
jgi:hypothetical protein